MSVEVKCRRCGEMLNKEKDEFVKLSNGYAHKKCEDEWQVKRNTVICQICREKINKLTDEYIKKSNGYIHKNCINPEIAEKQELNDYICELFHLKAPGPVNLSLINKYHTQNNYSYKSMLYTLKYFYEVQKNSVDKSNNRIGIIPYVYDDAKEYYNRIQRTSNIIVHNVEAQLKQEEKTIKVMRIKKNKKQLIDLEGLN